MHVNMKTLTLAVIIATLASALVGLQPMKVSASVRTVGVNVGDSADYTVTASGNGTSTGALSAFLNISYVRLTVTAIQMPTNITSEYSIAFKNGTQISGVYFVDVDTGEGNATGMFIGANLVANDLIYPGSASTDWTGAYINETMTKNYLGYDVSVCHLNKTQAVTSPYGNASWSMNYYWIQNTGMFAEFYYSYQVRTTTYYEWLMMDETLTPVVPEFPTPLILPFFMVISTFAAVFATKILRKRQIQR